MHASVNMHSNGNLPPPPADGSAFGSQPPLPGMSGMSSMSGELPRPPHMGMGNVMGNVMGNAMGMPPMMAGGNVMGNVMGNGMMHPGGGFLGIPAAAPNAPAYGVGADMSAIGMTPLNLKKFKYLQPRAQDQSIPESCTIYINNINDRIKLKELKDNLKSMFKQFGTIRQITAMSSFWRRGQAWIVFSNVESATAAINGMQGFVYHGQPLHINYSINKPDILAKEDGTFTKRAGGPKKPRAVREREERQKELYVRLQQQYMQLQGVPGGKTDAASLVASVQSKTTSEPAPPKPAPAAASSSEGPVQPHKVLFVENLPDYCTNALLQDAFSRSEGLVDIRAILSRKVAFVEYTSERLAAKALQELQGAKISGIPIRLSYARK